MLNSNSGIIKQNVEIVRGQIDAAARRAGRDPSQIRLIAVSKTKPAADVYEAYNAGVTAFGENYVQELLAKQASAPLVDLPDIEWHMIGHIQTNKVKSLIGKTALIHSLDSIRLAEVIQKHAEAASVTVDALLEVNVAREPNKYGFFMEEAHKAVETIALFKNIKIRGIMTSAPFVKTPEQNRTYFHKLNELYLDISCKSIDNTRMHILSMGMSGDFEVAVEEGSTMVRIGTRLFGVRESGLH